MKYDISTLMFTAALAIVVSGCAHQQMGSSNSSFNPFCALVGAATAGGGAAALGAAAGPIGAGVFVGAMLGSLACAQDEPATAQPLAAVVPPPAPSPEPIAAPDLDADGDGVVDRLDRCPGTPAGTRVGANGCPDILLTLTGVNFEFDSSAIDPASEQILQQSVHTLNQVTAVDIRVVGHTDSVGSDTYNQALSKRRADAVRDYLIGHGIPAGRLGTEGMGESAPVAANETAEGRYRNRRVELHVVGGESGMSSGQSSTATSTETWRSRDHHVNY